ncbi:MAG TPA: SDR family oxidoreductase [Xanthobacteraceae bacterium]|jgi:NAD(P)-dependent dehydrogenase (short-subunit alcohol dehydrogenase family)
MRRQDAGLSRRCAGCADGARSAESRKAREYRAKLRQYPPDDIANVALFLASDDSRLITKQTISVNAGVL